MRLHHFYLKFIGEDSHLEEAYCQDSFDKNLRYLRVCHVLALIAFSSIGIVDYILFPEHFILAWTIRYIFAAPVFLIGLGLTYTSIYRRYWQQMAFVYVLVTGLASLVIIGLMPQPDSYVYFVHIIISIMFGLLFVREQIGEQIESK